MDQQSARAVSTLYVGIDIAKKTNIAAFLGQKDQEVLRKPLVFPNNQLGAETLEKTILAVCQQKRINEVIIGTEATSVYDWHLVDFLAGSEKLPQASIYRLNPKSVKKFKDVLPDKDKTDEQDAITIAKKLRFGDLPKPYQLLAAYRPLQRLTRYRQHLVWEIVKEKNIFLNQLFMQHSALATEKPIKRILGETSQRIISEFLTPEELVEADPNELTSLIMKSSRNHYANPEEIAKLVQQVSRESYRIRPNLAKSLKLVISMSLRSIRAYQAALKDINRAIQDEIRALSQTLTSVPGIGPIFAGGILAEIGEIERFASHNALAKYAGLWWPRHQSGEFEAEERKLRKTGNAYLRYYLVEAANSLRVHNEEFRRFYQTKLKEVSRHAHKRALVLTARKFVRLVYALLKSRALYRENYQTE